MFFRPLVTVLSLAASVTAQNAPGFPISVSSNLEVRYTDTNTTITPGILVPRSSILNAPSVTAQSAATDTAYILLMIDQDVSRNGTLVQLLHWFQPNLVTSSNGSLAVDVVASNASTAVGASYIPPNPPAGSGPHRYTFILYQQPSAFSVPSQYAAINPPADTSARVSFNVTEFVNATGLGQPIAANYLRVLNGTAEESTSASTQTGTTGVAAPTGTEATATSGSGSASSTGGGSSASATASAGGGAEMRGASMGVLSSLGMAVVWAWTYLL